MTRKELSDNLSFLSALKMLEGLAAAGKLTNEEKEKAREELERRLRRSEEHTSELQSPT